MGEMTVKRYAVSITGSLFLLGRGQVALARYQAPAERGEVVTEIEPTIAVRSNFPCMHSVFGRVPTSVPISPACC